MAPIALFPDTNLFLHYKPVTDIDWRSLVAGKDVRLVVCLQVIKELDEKKNHSELGDRAARAIREIRSCKSNMTEVRPGVTLEIFNEEIRLDRLPSHMSPDSADDRIVYQAKQYAQVHSIEDVAVVTEDYGMELRCDASGLRSISPDPADRLPDPDSELKKKNQRLANELATLTNRLPKLSLRATGGTTSSEAQFSIELKRPEPLDPELETRAKRSVHVTRHPPNAESDPYRLATRYRLDTVPDSEYARYNRELEEYFQAYSTYVPLRSGYLDARARSFPFELLLDNVGTSPAEDVDVHLHIPADVIESVTKEPENDLEIPAQPALPKEPSSLLMGMNDLASYREPSPSYLDTLLAPVRHDGLQWSRVLREGNEFVIRAKIGRLKHTLTISIGKFRARFASWDVVHPLHTTCSITAGNHPTEVTQSLGLRVRIGSP